MRVDAQSELGELADLIHAIARELPAPPDLEPGPCTPVEINVMRFVGKNPGCLAGAAAKAVRLPTSNFSRAVNGLVEKGLVLRRADERDARIVRLYATERAGRNARHMRESWSRTLATAGLDSETLASINAGLRKIESGLRLSATDDLRMRDGTPATLGD